MLSSASSSHRSDGFSLTEILVGISIMATVFGGFFAAITQSHRMQETSRMTTIGAEIIQNEIENLRELTWTEFEALPASAALDIPASFGAVRLRFSGTRTISTVRAAETHKVIVSVSWQTPGHDVHTRRIWTYVSKHGRAYVNTGGP